MTAVSWMKRRAGRGVGRASQIRIFCASEHGNIAVTFALALLPLTLFVGAGVDIGRWLHAREETIAAMDAAVLAGARALQTDSTNTAGAIAAAQAYYKANTKSRFALISDSITFAPADNNTTFRSSGNAYISTPILSLASIKSLPILHTNGTEYAKAVLSAGGQSQTSIEIGVMLDITGSMTGTKFTDLKSAATDLVNIVVSDQVGTNTVKVGIVPFAEGVRLPASANTAARGSPAATKTISYTNSRGRAATATYKSTPCVVERTGTNKYTDAAPGSGNYVMTMYNTAGTCGLSSDDEVLPLTSDKTALTNKINALDIAGSTAGQVGTAWAWYVLSPNWSTLWPSSAAGAYSTKLQKIAILMTDGEYNLQYDANGIATGSTGAGAAANTDSTTQARAVCAAMKTAKITVYTVGFDLGGNQTAIDTLSGCATDSSKFYSAEDGSQLKQAFRDIALKINQLYLTH